MIDVEVVEEEGGLWLDLDLFLMIRLLKEFFIGFIIYFCYFRWKISFRYFKVKKMMEIIIVVGEGGVFYLDDEKNIEILGVFFIYFEREIKMF